MSLAWLGALGLRVISRTNDRADDRYTGILAASLIAAAAIVLAYTAVTGALTGRYLIPICLIVVAAMASATAATMRAYALIRALFLLACMATIVQTAREPHANPMERGSKLRSGEAEDLSRCADRAHAGNTSRRDRQCRSELYNGL